MRGGQENLSRLFTTVCLSERLYMFVCVRVRVYMYVRFHSSFRSPVRSRSHPFIFTYSPFSCALSYNVLLLLSILLLGYVHRRCVRDALTCTSRYTRGCRIPRYTRCRKSSESPVQSLNNLKSIFPE